MNPMNFVRVRDRKLSLWQSATAKHVRQLLTVNDKRPAMADVLKHPMSIAAAEHVSQLHDNKDFIPLAPAVNSGHASLVYQSHISLQVAEAILHKDLTKLEALAVI